GLDERIVPAVSASFDPRSGVVAVFGDGRDNVIDVSRDAGGKLFVNGNAVSCCGRAATVANTSLILVFGEAGNDRISMNDANGALPTAFLFGGAGNDVLTGSSAADLIFGEAGDDTLQGKGGNDFLFGGTGNDTFVWNPGDASDIIEGQGGIDTLQFNG